MRTGPRASRPYLERALAICSALFVLCAHQAIAEPIVVRIGTTPTLSKEMTGEKARPGWMIEVLDAAGARANVKFRYVLKPWDEVLRLVRTGRIEGAFNSSYSPDRAVYGAYPMKDGAADPSRATKEYVYSLYVRKGAAVTWDGKRIENLSGPIAVEKSAAIIPFIEKLGLAYGEYHSYESMLSQLATGRVNAIAGINKDIQFFLNESPDRFGELSMLEPPLQSRIGYLMFSKLYCEKYPSVCDAVWDAIGELRATGEYGKIKSSYDDE